MLEVRIAKSALCPLFSGLCFIIDNAGPSTYKKPYYDSHKLFVKYFYKTNKSLRSEYGF